jgi:NAD(P)H-dependent FMN reductase
VSTERPLFIPVILGTSRQGRMSEHAARFMLEELQKRENVETVLVDVRELNFPIDDEDGGIKDAAFSQLCERADAYCIVAPEYNHGYPGSLKHALDTNLKEYVHKAVGLCGVSAGGFGGTRVIENLLPVLRELGLMAIFTDVNFSRAGKIFDESGALLDESYIKRTASFLEELVWMAETLRYGRDNVKYISER